jgi:YD repeat-containing protein
MKKNQLCLTLLAGFIISNCLLSCKKDAAPSKPDCKIVAVISESNATPFTYDADGRLSSKNSSTGTDRFTYNGNTDVPAQTGDFWNLSNLVQGYETVRTKNALTSIESGGSISTINYVFDAEGKITGLNNISNGVLVTLSYQYECN